MHTLALGRQPLPMPSWQNAVFPMLDSMFIDGTRLIPEPIARLRHKRGMTQTKINHLTHSTIGDL